jgi:hypothetical protein
MHPPPLIRGGGGVAGCPKKTARSPHTKDKMRLLGFTTLQCISYLSLILSLIHTQKSRELGELPKEADDASSGGARSAPRGPVAG